MSRYNLTAYTGPNPDSGYVGYVNLSVVDGENVVFTVRQASESGYAMSHSVPIDQARKMLVAALAELDRLADDITSGVGAS